MKELTLHEWLIGGRREGTGSDLMESERDMKQKKLTHSCKLVTKLHRSSHTQLFKTPHGASLQSSCPTQLSNLKLNSETMEDKEFKKRSYLTGEYGKVILKSFAAFLL